MWFDISVLHCTEKKKKNRFDASYKRLNHYKRIFENRSCENTSPSHGRRALDAFVVYYVGKPKITQRKRASKNPQSSADNTNR